MSGLSPDARAILDAARDGDDPTATDRERIRHAVFASVGGAVVASGGAASTAAASVTGSAAAATGTAATAAAAGTAAAGTAAATGTATALGGGLALKLVGVLVATGVTVGTVALDPWPSRDPSAGDFEGVPVAETVGEPDVGDEDARSVEEPRDVTGGVAAAEVEAELPLDADGDSAHDRDRDSAHDHVRDHDRVHDRARVLDGDRLPPTPPTLDPAELGLLRAAHTALREGAPGAALGQLDEHARRFPDGMLAAERRAARALALCALGRVAEGSVEADAFLAAHPGSPLAARVRTACR